MVKVISSQKSGERIVGIALLLVLVLVSLSMSLGAGRVGLDSRSEYFHGNGSESWAVVATLHQDQLADGLMPLAATSAVLVALAGVVYLTLRRYASLLASAVSVGFLTSGVLMAIGAAMRFRVADLAGRWSSTSSGADGLADSAFTAHSVYVLSMFTALPLFMASLIAVGILAQRATTLPRWLLTFPWVGGALLIISPIGFAIGPGFGALVMASGATLLLWLVVVSGRLILRGAR